MNKRSRDRVVARAEVLDAVVTPYVKGDEWGVNLRLNWLGVLFRPDGTVGLALCTRTTTNVLLAENVRPTTAWAALRRVAKGSKPHQIIRDLKVAS